MDSACQKAFRILYVMSILLSLSHLSARAQEDAGLDNVPFPVRYAHPHRTTAAPLGLHLNPIANLDAETKQHYFQSQDLEDKGMKQFLLKRYDAAVSSLTSALALWPNSENAYRWLAETYAAKGQTDEAIFAYRHLFYGWPERVKLNDLDKLNDFQTDPTLLMQFSLLLQQTNQYLEAKQAYNRGAQVLAAKLPKGAQLPPLSAADLAPPNDLEAATRTALAIDQVTYQDWQDAGENLNRALQLKPGFSTAQFHLNKIKATR